MCLQRSSIFSSLPTAASIANGRARFVIFRSAKRPSRHPSTIMVLLRFMRITLLLLPTLLLAQQSPQQAVHHFKTAPGLDVTLWAAEPLLENPTNIDIDERGRIWVLEGVNYRRQL